MKGYIYPDKGPRDTIFHKRILRTKRIPNTRCGNWLELECGHRVMAFGDLAHAGGVVLCDQCLSNSRKGWMSDDNRIDISKLSPATIERMRVIAMQQCGKPLDESDPFAEITDEAMARLLAEAERTGETVHEIIDRIARKSDV